jgi:Xaa-Pro aminopeptidase
MAVMDVLEITPYVRRLTALREDFATAALDALVVTHPPNIRYLSGFSGSAGVLVITPDRATLVVDFRYAAAARRLTGSNPTLADALNVRVALQGLDEALLEELRPCQRIGIESQSMTVARFNALSSALADGAPTPLNTEDPCPILVPTERLVETRRAVKDASEIRILRLAGFLLKQVAAEVPGLVRPGRTELEIAADIDLLLRRAGFDRPAFETIVASGPNGALPHARPSRRTVEPEDGVVLDFGGVYDGYCVDLTRTVELGPGRQELRPLFSAVAQAQSAAIAAIRPGVMASQVDEAARQTLARHGLAEAFGHGTGHGLGLEVHEEPRIGRFSSAHRDTVLEPGMVFTVEPGVYVEGLGGVRIEDDVLVTDDGCEVLTR